MTYRYDEYKAQWIRHLNSVSSSDTEAVKSAELWIDEHLRGNDTWNKQLFCDLLSDASQPLALHQLAGKCLRMMLTYTSPMVLASLRSNWTPELGKRLKEVVTPRLFAEDGALRSEMLFTAVLIFGIETPKLWPEFLGHLYAELDGSVKCKEDHAVTAWLNVFLEIGRLGNLDELVSLGYGEFVKLAKLVMQCATQPGDWSIDVRDLSVNVLRRYVKLCPQLLVASDPDRFQESLQQFLASLEVPMKLGNAKLFGSCLALIKRVVKLFYDKIESVLEKVHVLATLPWSSEFTTEPCEFRLRALEFWTKVGRYEAVKLKQARVKHPDVNEDTLEDLESKIVNREIDLLFDVFVQELKSLTSRDVESLRRSPAIPGNAIPAFQAADAVQVFYCAAQRRMGAKILDTGKVLSESDKWEDKSAASELLWGLGDPTKHAYVRREVSDALIPGPTEFLLKAVQNDQEPMLRRSALRALGMLLRTYNQEYRTMSVRLLESIMPIFRETTIDATMPTILEAELELIPPLLDVYDVNAKPWSAETREIVRFFFDFAKMAMVRGQKLDDSRGKSLCSAGGGALSAVVSSIGPDDPDVVVRLFPETLEMLRQSSTLPNTQVISTVQSELCNVLGEIIGPRRGIDKDQMMSLVELLLLLVQQGNSDVRESVVDLLSLAIGKSPVEIPTGILESLVQLSEESIRSGVRDLIWSGAYIMGEIINKHCNIFTKAQFDHLWNLLLEILHGPADLRGAHSGLIYGLSVMLEGAAKPDSGILDDPESIARYNDQVSRLLSTIGNTNWDPESESDAEYIHSLLLSLGRLHIVYCKLFHPLEGKYARKDFSRDDMWRLEREALMRYLAYAEAAGRLLRPKKSLFRIFARVCKEYGARTSRKNNVTLNRLPVHRFLSRFQDESKYPSEICQRARKVLKFLKTR